MSCTLVRIYLMIMVKLPLSTVYFIYRAYFGSLGLFCNWCIKSCYEDMQRGKYTNLNWVKYEWSSHDIVFLHHCHNFMLKPILWSLKLWFKCTMLLCCFLSINKVTFHYHVQHPLYGFSKYNNIIIHLELQSCLHFNGAKSIYPYKKQRQGFICLA